MALTTRQLVSVLVLALAIEASAAAPYADSNSSAQARVFHGFCQPEDVAQTSSLLYRGFPIRRCDPAGTDGRLEVGDTAGWKPALRGLRNQVPLFGYEISGQELPANRPGRMARYLCEAEAGLPAAVVRAFSMGWGQSEQTSQGDCRWLFIKATKASGQEFRVWLLTHGYPPATLAGARRRVARFIVQPGNAAPLEFRDAVTGEAVLPALGGWYYLLPRPADPGGAWPAAEGFPERTEYLGHRYRLLSEPEPAVAASPPKATPIDLRPEVLVGVPGNTRQQETARRYDGSDYTLRRLTRQDFREMAEAGINCLRVDAEQRGWVEDLAVFYWGVGGSDVPYPECLYDSRYLGPALFLDEPAVHARDYVIRPRLAKDQAFRRALTPQIMLEAFQATFARACLEGAPTSLLQGLAARADVALGSMKFRQANLFSWETMVSTAACQLSQDPQVPSAMVFEPPGRVGTLRTLPEFDMSYGCQIPVDDPNTFNWAGEAFGVWGN